MINLDEGIIIDLAKEAIWTVITVAGPMLLLALAVGLLVSIFQAITSIQEPTLAFIPKILAVFVGIMIFGPFMLTRLLEFFTDVYTNFPYYIR